MLVPTIFHPATFSCSGGCSVPHHHGVPIQSVPSLSGEDGSKFPVPSFTGHVLGGIPLGHEVDTLGVQPPPVSSACLIHAAEGGVLPTNHSIESDSLEIRLGTGQSGYSALDPWQHLSKVAMACCQPSASRRGMMTK